MSSAPQIVPLQIAPGINKDSSFLDSQNWADGGWIRFKNKKPVSMPGMRSIINFEDDVNEDEFFWQWSGEFRYRPRGCISISSPNEINLTNVIAGFSLDVWNENRRRAVCIFSINNDTFNMQSSQMLVNVDNVNFDLAPGAVQECFWHFNIINNASFSPRVSGKKTLFACIANGLKGIGANKHCYPVMYACLDGVYNTNEPLVAQQRLNCLSITGVTDFDAPIPESKRVYCTAGTLSVGPYLFLLNYGVWENNEVKTLIGTIAYTYPSLIPGEILGPDDIKKTIIQGVIPVTNTNIVAARQVRGSTLSLIIWSEDSLFLGNYSSNPQTPFSFTPSPVASCSILSANSIVEVGGIFFWLGVNQVYTFSGVLKPLPLDGIQDYFFNSLDRSNASKCWGIYLEATNEIMWVYPNYLQDNYDGECNAYIKRNLSESCWDTGFFPVTDFDLQGISGRGCGCVAPLFSKPIMFDSYASPYAEDGMGNERCYKMWAHEIGDAKFGANDLVLPLRKKGVVRAPQKYAIPKFITSNILSLNLKGSDNKTLLRRFECSSIQNSSIYLSVYFRNLSNDTFTKADGVSTNLYGFDLEAICKIKEIPGTGEIRPEILGIDGNESQNFRFKIGFAMNVFLVVYNNNARGNEVKVTGVLKGAPKIIDLVIPNFDGGVSLEKSRYINVGTFSEVTEVKVTGGDYRQPRCFSVGISPLNQEDIRDPNLGSVYYKDLYVQARQLQLSFYQKKLGGKFMLGVPLLTLSEGDGF